MSAPPRLEFAGPGSAPIRQRDILAIVPEPGTQEATVALTLTNAPSVPAAANTAPA